MTEMPRPARDNPLATEVFAPVRAAWYVAAYADELGAEPLARTICGEEIVLFRRGDGRPAALVDRCAHRKFPLSLGTIVGDTLQCGYHGARFDGDGVCRLIPGQESIPHSLAVRAYPVREVDGIVLIWMGDPAAAGAAPLPDWRLNDAEGWTTVRGRHVFQANYQLVLDNLLDLTHIAFVHKMLKGPGIVENALDFSVEDETVTTYRMMRGVELPGIYRAMGKSGTWDRWTKQTVQAPGYVYFETGAEIAGANTPPGPPHHVVIQGITPETERTTHYFWSVARSFALGDPDTSRAFFDISRDAFDEDAAVLAAQQRAVDADRSGRPLGAFAADGAGLAVRRIVQ
ncbi:MAG TPA: aromatic ring-hydroxylating dioxygenase subunit alpha, partial [Hyphomicrobiales bacterium]|nr:aromatic ring-hydroxylating dioxygenase subunit alpha [Hyphomicrobiales bacterium]